MIFIKKGSPSIPVMRVNGNPKGLGVYVPTANGPRLQAGDILLIGGRECRVKALLKTKAVARELHCFASRDFTVACVYALSHRRRPPKRLPHTSLLQQTLRRGDEPAPVLLRAAVSEAHLDTVDRDGQTALHLAAQRGMEGAVEVLCSAGSRIDQPDFDGETALMKAARGGHARCVALLTGTSSASIDATTLGGFTALMLAAAAGRLECVELLLHHRASMERCEHTTSERSDALRLACTGGHQEVAKLLGGHGAPCRKSVVGTSLFTEIRDERVRAIAAALLGSVTSMADSLPLAVVWSIAVLTVREEIK